MVADAAKAAGLLFVAVVVQVVVLSPVDIVGGGPDLVLVALAGVALLRGALFGACCGFYAGFLLDTAHLETLGVTSLLLVLAGYWVGRYGETTGRTRSHAPLLAVGVVTVLYVASALGLHFMLGDPVSARAALVDRLPAETAFNLVLTIPVFAVCRRVLRADDRFGRRHEVEFA